MKIILLIAILLSGQHITISVEPIPVIYTTDLFHPKDDADDVYDLAAIYAMPIDLKGIILEQGLKQDARSGSVAVQQMNEITGRNIPYAVGLANPLQTKLDTGLDQPAQYQKGVEMILNILRQSTKKVSIVSVGSLRDVAAAYNREPELFRNKLDRLLVFAGEATIDFKEYNVELDTNAYVQIMNSGLNIYWIPCFDGGLWQNNGKASFWRAEKQSDLLEGIDPKLTRYFVYNLLDKTEEPIGYLNSPTNMTDVNTVYNDYRNLWCTVIFQSLLGVYDRNTFDFVPVNVHITDEGYPRYNQPDAKPIMQFKVNDSLNYKEKMTEYTHDILTSLRAS